MGTVIARILELSGPLPDLAAHKRYLNSLGTDALQRRLAALEADRNNPHTPRWFTRRTELQTA